MIEIKGKTLQELEDLYDNVNEEEKQWMHDNLLYGLGKKNPNEMDHSGLNYLNLF